MREFPGKPLFVCIIYPQEGQAVINSFSCGVGKNMIPIDKESQSLIAPHFINFYPSGPVGCLGSSSHQACHLAAILIVTFNYIIVKFELCVSVNMQRKWCPKSQSLNINALLDKRQKHHIVISLFYFVWPPFPFPSF